MSDLLKLGGLWKTKTGKGLSGQPREDNYTRPAFELMRSGDPFRVLVFKNDRKEQDNHPDYNMFLAPVEDSNTQNWTPPPGDDDIPF